MIEEEKPVEEAPEEETATEAPPQEEEFEDQGEDMVTPEATEA